MITPGPSVEGNRVPGEESQRIVATPEVQTPENPVATPPEHQRADQVMEAPTLDQQLTTAPEVVAAPEAGVVSVGSEFKPDPVDAKTKANELFDRQASSLGEIDQLAEEAAQLTQEN